MGAGGAEFDDLLERSGFRDAVPVLRAIHERIGDTLPEAILHRIDADPEARDIAATPAVRAEVARWLEGLFLGDRAGGYRRDRFALVSRMVGAGVPPDWLHLWAGRLRALLHEEIERTFGGTPEEVARAGDAVDLALDLEVALFTDFHRQVERHGSLVRDLLDSLEPSFRGEGIDLSSVERTLDGILTQVRERMRRDRELERGLLQASGVIVLTLDRGGVVRSVNREGREALGLSAEEVIGRDWLDAFVAAPSRTAAGAALRGALSGGPGGEQGIEIVLTGAGGGEREVEARHFPLTDSSGRVERCLVSALDVTERRRLARAIDESKALLDLGRMASVVAHEVRSPLAGISGAVQVIAKRLPSGSPEHAAAERIVRRIRVLDETVDDILVFARTHHLRPEPARLRSIVHAVRDDLREDEAFREVVVEVRGEDPEVRCDPGMIRSVFQNLLANSAVAMEGNGRIRVTVGADGDECVVEVADDGPGIPPDQADRVFEPFFTTRRRGTGLGLSIVKQFVGQHGGTIALAPGPSRGATFVIRLPRDPGAAAT